VCVCRLHLKRKRRSLKQGNPRRLCRYAVCMFWGGGEGEEGWHALSVCVCRQKLLNYFDCSVVYGCRCVGVGGGGGLRTSYFWSPYFACKGCYVLKCKQMVPRGVFKLISYYTTCVQQLSNWDALPAHTHAHTHTHTHTHTRTHRCLPRLFKSSAARWEPA
jgi:hypothetical protein